MGMVMLAVISNRIFELCLDTSTLITSRAVSGLIMMGLQLSDRGARAIMGSLPNRSPTAARIAEPFCHL